MPNTDFTENVQMTAPIKVLRRFQGRIIDVIPELLKSDGGRTPLDFTGLIDRRLEDTADAEVLRNDYVTTSSPFFVREDGSVLLVPYSNPVAKGLVDGLNPQSELQGYSLIVSPETIEEIEAEGDGMIISANNAQALRNNPYDKPKLREEVFEFQAGSQEQATKYGNLVDKVTSTSIKGNRGLWLPSNKGMRLFWVYSVGYYYSSADRSYYLGNINARPVGVSNGVASAEGASARSVDDLVRDVPEANVKAVLGKVFSPEYANELLQKITAYKAE